MTSVVVDLPKFCLRDTYRLDIILSKFGLVSVPVY